MASTNPVVYPLTSSTPAELAAGHNKLLIIPEITLDNSVTVTDISNVSGTVTNGTDPIENAYISINQSPGTIVYMTRTNTDGDFTISVPEGTGYTLTIVAEGYALYTSTPTINTSTVDLGTITLTADADLASTAKAILGTVVNVTTAIAPTEPVFVTLLDGTTTVGVTALNADGDFAFIGLSTPTTGYTIQITSAFYQTYTSPSPIALSATTFTILDDTSITPILYNTSSLIEGTTTTNGTPVDPYSTVILYKEDNAVYTPISYTKATSTGYYAFVIPTSATPVNYYVSTTLNDSL